MLRVVSPFRVKGRWVERKMTHLIHFVNALLDFWLRILQKLEERGNPWEDFPKPLELPRPEHVAHIREFASLFWLIVPTGRDYIPNWVLQQSALAGVFWTRWSFTSTNIGDHILHVAFIIGQYPCEDLIAAR